MTQVTQKFGRQHLLQSIWALSINQLSISSLVLPQFLTVFLYNAATGTFSALLKAIPTALTPYPPIIKAR